MIARCNKWTESPIKMWNCEDFVKQHLWAERCKAVHERSTFWEVFLGCVAANGEEGLQHFFFTWSTTFESVGGKLGKCWLHNWSLSFAKSYSPFSTPLSWKKYLHLEMEIYDGKLQARARNKIETNNPIPCDMLWMEINWLWIDSVSLRLGGNCW